MRNKKGFTLMEIIGAIIVLGLLLLIGIPTITKYINQGKNSYYISLEREIKVSGMDYLETYRTLLPRKVDHVKVIDLQELVDNKYLDPVKDENGDLCVGQVTVEKVKKDSYKYYSCLKCGKYDEQQENGEMYGKYYATEGKACEYKESDNVYADSGDYRIVIHDVEVDTTKGFKKYTQNGMTVYEIPQGEAFTLPTATVYHKVDNTEEVIDNNLEGNPKVIDVNELLTNQEVIYYYHGAKSKIKVIVKDKTKPSKPEVVLKYNNKNGNNYNGNWTNRNIYAEYKSTDYTKKGVLGTGIDYYEISTNNGSSYSKITANTQLHSTQGEKTFYIRAVDKAGNKSDPASYTVKIDNTVPSCGLVASGTEGSNGWFISDVSISYDQTAMNGTGSDVVISLPISDITESVKNKVIIGTITDAAGNTSTCTITVNMDKDIPNPPTITATDNKASGTWHTEDVTLNLSGANNVSGNSYYYKADSEINETQTGATKGKKIEYKTDTKSKTYYTVVCSGSGLCSGNSSYEIKLDKTPPECTIAGTSTSWTKNNRTITYGCSDETSECKSNRKGGSTTFSVTTKTTTIDAYTIEDNAGNVTECEEQTANVYVDKTAPSVPTIANPKEDSWTNDNVTLTLASNDKVNTSYTQSGNIKYQYSLDKSTWTDYDSATPEISEEQDRTIYIRACDKVGNCSSENETIMRIDKHAPADPTITNPTNGEWTNTNFKLTLESSDTGAANSANSGISYYQYKFADTDWKSYANSNTSPFTTTNFSKERNELVYIRVCDYAGNCSEESSTYIRIDKTEPSCSVTVTKGTAGINSWYRSDVELGITSNKGTGSDIASATLDKNKVTAEGTTTVTGTVTDQAGNSDTCTMDVKIDKTAPTCSLEVKSGTAGINGWYRSEVEMKFKSTNGTGSPVKSSSIDNTKFSTEGSTTVTGSIEDEAGNTNTCTKVIKIDTTKPTCSLKVKTGTEGNSGWYTTSVKMDWDSKDGTGSPVKTSTIDKTDITTEGTTTVTGTIEDEAGNTNTCTKDIKVDLNDPTCSLKVTEGTSGKNDWYRSDVKVGWNQRNDTTNGSGVKTSASSIDQTTISTEGETTVTGTVVDNSGRTGTCTKVIKIDKTKPTCSLKVTSGTEGSSGWYTTAVTIDWNAKNGTGSSIDTSSIDKTSVTTEGTTTVTGSVKDEAGNTNTCTKDIKVDLNDPTCSIKVTEGTKGTNDWYRSTVKVGWDQRNDTTNGSGVKTSASSIDQTTISTEGETTVTGTVVDNSGRTGTCTKDIKIDTTKPTCTVNVTSGTEGSNGWYKSKVDLSISTNKGTGSNIKSSSLDKNSVTAEGTTTVTGSVEDEAGNTNSCTKTVKVDLNNPTCTLAASGTEGSNGWYKSAVTIGWDTKTDTTNGSGVTSFNIDKTSISSQGSTTATGSVTDDSGRSGTCTKTVKIDTTLPTITYSKDGPYFNRETDIKITAEDTNLVKLESKLNDSSASTNTTTTTVNGKKQITKTYTLSNAGKYTIKSKATDEAGNTQDQTPSDENGWYYKEYTLNLDPPTCELKVKSGTLGENGWYTSDVVVELTATPGGAPIAVKSIENIINGEIDSTTTSSTMTLTKETTNHVIAIVTDESGQNPTNPCSLDIKIDKTGPKLLTLNSTLTQPTEEQLNNLEYTYAANNITISGTAKKSSSGIKEYQYTFKDDALNSELPTETSTKWEDSNSKWVSINKANDGTYSNDWQTYSKTFMGERAKYLFIRVCDYAGQCSNALSSWYGIDKTPPTVPVITNSNYHNKWAKESYKLGLSSTDEGSGIANYQYTYNENATTIGSDSSTQWIVYSNSDMEFYTTPDFQAERNQNVYIRACDKVGNCSAKASERILIDKTTPILAIDTATNTYFNNKNQKVTISGSDRNFMRLTVSAFLNGYEKDQQWIDCPSATDTSSCQGKEYTVALDQEGAYAIYSLSQDWAGQSNKSVAPNWEQWHIRYYYVDTTPPKIKYSIAGGNYTGNQHLTISSEDKNFDYMVVNMYKDGTKIPDETISSTNYKTYELTPGVWDVYVRARDKAGNAQSTSSISSGEWYYQKYTITSTAAVQNYPAIPTCTSGTLTDAGTCSVASGYSQNCWNEQVCTTTECPTANKKCTKSSSYYSCMCGGSKWNAKNDETGKQCSFYQGTQQTAFTQCSPTSTKYYYTATGSACNGVANTICTVSTTSCQNVQKCADGTVTYSDATPVYTCPYGGTLDTSDNMCKF